MLFRTHYNERLSSPSVAGVDKSPSPLVGSPAVLLAPAAGGAFAAYDASSAPSCGSANRVSDRPDNAVDDSAASPWRRGGATGLLLPLSSPLPKAGEAAGDDERTALLRDGAGEDGPASAAPNRE